MTKERTVFCVGHEELFSIPFPCLCWISFRCPFNFRYVVVPLASGCPKAGKSGCRVSLELSCRLAILFCRYN